ncbi:uncharacterized protein LOC135217241 [Macrobrachium nipponense]|uniref:uncharacterized protein LOC135217241 n=1 Tax=Macrobrachium nipponense TaxID=159736 RepID=UPI0030C81AE6
MRISTVILCSILSGAWTQKEFYKKYAFTKVMSECLGGNVYYAYLQQVANARRECEVQSLFIHSRMPIPNLFSSSNFGFSHVPNVISTTGSPFPSTFGTPRPATPGVRTVITREPPPLSLFGEVEVPVVTLTSDLPFGPRLPAFRQKRALVYTPEDIEDAKMRVRAMIGNFTCVLSRLGVVNENLDINYDGLSHNLANLPVPSGLKTDLLSSINTCKDLVTCLPLETRGTLVPHQLERLIAFVRCEKDARFTACLKNDLRRNLDQFGLNLLPRFSGGNEDSETLLNLIVKAESAFEMELI